MSGPVVRAENVHKTYRSTRAVEALGFSVQPSTCFGLLGPNGAGKTTMMKMVYGKCRRDLDPPGSISVFGHDPDREELDIKFISGVVPQEDNLDEELSVWQNLHVYATFYRIDRREQRRRIDELLTFMELADKQRARIRELSGGMKRRLVIARALLNRPRLLILDEPTTGLDPQVRHVIWEKLKELRAGGLTILLTTHYMEEASRLCDRLLIMDNARKLMEGSPGELVMQRIEPFVLELAARAAFERIPKSALSDGVRVDESTDAVRLYSRDSDRLHELVSHVAPGDAVLRQANLEDLFLDATGRQLNARQ